MICNMILCLLDCDDDLSPLLITLDPRYREDISRSNENDVHISSGLRIISRTDTLMVMI